MNAKNNRHNHDFQIAYFLAGSCHTTDGAYALLCDLKEGREMALASAKAAGLRIEARIWWGKFLKRFFCWLPPVRLVGQAMIEEIEATKEVSQKCYTAAEDELAFINKCIDAITPHRKFSHLPEKEAHEAAQREEWKLELASRAKNELTASGRIGPELLGTIRMHPDGTEILSGQIENKVSIPKLLCLTFPSISTPEKKPL